ncbi:MAG: HPr(Ser) kinase/phosphatase [Candidatus Margulisbacteria bacterium]|nr:HPr(Ser) kinase/phosphatase [Candidatus Margulisiibacteriota bacterium]
MNRKVTTNIKNILSYSESANNSLFLTLHNPKLKLTRAIASLDINRPGMNLFGFFDFFAFDRVQIMGKGESAYVDTLLKANKIDSLKELFEYEIPGMIFTHDYKPPAALIEIASANAVPIISSTLTTSKLISLIHDYFHKVLAPKEIVHGVLMEVFGIGVHIEGDSGVGKSECALELIERGHRFIADDIVDIKLFENNYLIGSGSKVIAHHMEIRGIGIINIAHLYGVGSIRHEKKIDLIVNLEHLKQNIKYDRVGLKNDYKKILGINIPKITIPIQPGSNIPILVETAAKNQRLKKFGYNPAKEFSKKLTSLIDKGEMIY